MNRMLPILVVGAGGFIGTILRYLLSLVGQRFSFTFPHGTLWANLLGCLALGIVTALATETETLSPATRLFLATGICAAKILDLSSDMPIVIEITDEEAKINSFLPTLHDLFEAANCGGLVTVERVQVIKYLHGKK